jgi:hypothetical protein
LLVPAVANKTEWAWVYRGITGEGQHYREKLQIPAKPKLKFDVTTVNIQTVPFNSIKLTSSMRHILFHVVKGIYPEIEADSPMIGDAVNSLATLSLDIGSLSNVKDL